MRPGMTNAIPLYGFEPFVLGRTKEQIERLAGAPSKVRFAHPDASSVEEIWRYGALGIELGFGSDDEWRLCNITIDSPRIAVNGVCFVGAGTGALEELAASAGITDIKLTDDFEESGACYMSDAHHLMLWAVDGAIVNVTLFPQYDDSGQVPLWPQS